MTPDTRSSSSVTLSVLLLSVFAIAPLAYPGLWQSRAGFLPLYAVLRIRRVGVLAALRPWVTAAGPLLPGALREGPLPYLAAYGLGWLGLSPPDALKIVAALALLTAAGMSYALANDVFGSPLSGLIAGLLFLYAPPLLTTIYARGRLAELWALALFPALLWSQRRPRRPIDLGLRFLLAFLVTLCQPGLSVFLVGLAVMYGLWCEVTPERFRLTAFSTIAGLGAGLVAWGLMLVGTVPTQTTLFFERFLFPADLFSSGWPAALGDGGPPLSIVAVLLALFAIARLGRLPRGSAVRRDVLFFLTAALILGAAPLQPLAPLWRLARLDHLLLAPWQLLAPASLVLAVGAVGLLSAEPRWQQGLWPFALALLVLVPAYPHLSPEFLSPVPRALPPAVFGGESIALVDARLDGALAPGGSITFRPRWQALRRLSRDYTLFVHIIDGAGQIWGQRDAMPVSGRRPTTSWRPGEIVNDAYSVAIDPAAPADLRIELGWYLLKTGERLPRRNGSTALILKPSELERVDVSR
jgi:hypothetical protein